MELNRGLPDVQVNVVKGKQTVSNGAQSSINQKKNQTLIFRVRLCTH
jgi:hypothetical protein